MSGLNPRVDFLVTDFGDAVEADLVVDTGIGVGWGLALGSDTGVT